VLLILSLVIHLISLPLPYRNQEDDIPRHEFGLVSIHGQIPKATGLALCPYAWIVLIACLVAVASVVATKPWFRWIGPPAILVAQFAFGIGGAPLRSSGGKLAFLSLGLTLLAILGNWIVGGTSRPVSEPGSA
jgi:hypothetical protein